MLELFSFVLSFVPKIFIFAVDVFEVFTTPVVDLITDNNMGVVASPVLSLLGDTTILDFMVSIGLPIIIVVGVVKFFLPTS